MTPLEKANELVVKFMRYVPADESMELPYSKSCALIAVDEILLDKQVGYSKEIIEEKKYWKQVKEEIEKL